MPATTVWFKFPVALLYLNHAGTSWPKPEAVRRAVADSLTESSPTQWTDSLASHRNAVAHFFGARPDRLALTSGCTAALRWILSTQSWRDGDQIVTSAWEHDALTGPIADLGDRGVEHVVIPPTADGPIDLDRLEHALRGGRVRMVAISTATNVTGAILPAAEICRLAQDHGARSTIDASQSVGWLPVDGSDADYVAFATHKGLQAPWGVGGLVCSERVEVPGDCAVGSVDRMALAGLVAAIDWLGQPAQADRTDHARGIIQTIATKLDAIEGIELLGPTSAHERVPTLALTAPLPPQRVAAELLDKNILVSGGHQCAQLAHRSLGTAEKGVVRISVGPQTPPAAADQLVSAMEAICQRK